MAMDMDNGIIADSIPELLDFSGYTTTTTPPTSDQDSNNWNHWSPLINWDSFTTDNDDFHNLIDSITQATAGAQILNSDSDHGGADEEYTDDAFISALTETTEDNEGSEGDDDFKGLRLVHLLMAAAEALTGATKSRDLAQVILVRLKELVSPTHGNSMERLAAHFTDALKSLLEGAGSGNNTTISGGVHIRDDQHQTDMLTAFQILQEMSPYVKFGHFTANQAILEAVGNERRVHIVDYDIMEGTQWASLIQAFSSSKDGPSGPHLRITALSRGASGRKSFATVQETGRRLTAFAASLAQPFSFHQCR